MVQTVQIVVMIPDMSGKSFNVSKDAIDLVFGKNGGFPTILHLRKKNSDSLRWLANKVRDTYTKHPDYLGDVVKIVIVVDGYEYQLEHYIEQHITDLFGDMKNPPELEFETPANQTLNSFALANKANEFQS